MQREIRKSDIVTSPDELRTMICDALASDPQGGNGASAVRDCDIQVLDGACYVPGKGFQGMTVSLPLRHAHRMMDVYNLYDQPLVSVASVFKPKEPLSNEQFTQIAKKAQDSRADLQGMCKTWLTNRKCDTSQFFAHYGRLCDLKHIYKQAASRDRKQTGGLCLWGSPSVTAEDKADLKETLFQIAKINGHDSHPVATETAIDQMTDEADSDASSGVGSAFVDQVGRDPDDEELHSQLLTDFNKRISDSRIKVEDFNMGFGHALCSFLDIPMKSINDQKRKKLWGSLACNLSTVNIEDERIVATMNAASPKDDHALVFHSPESGSTLYEMNKARKSTEPMVSASIGRVVTQGKPAANERCVMPHGVQIPPVIDSTGFNTYATREHPSSYQEDLVHKKAWPTSDSVHHISSEFYLSGAPHPVSEEGISNKEDLREFIGNLVLADGQEEKGASCSSVVYVPDKNGCVCDIVREAYPRDWVKILTAENAVTNETGDIIGWKLPHDKLVSV